MNDDYMPRHAKPSKVRRYPENTPVWVKMRDYYLQIAEDLELQGKKRKAKAYRKRAEETFEKAGGTTITI